MSAASTTFSPCQCGSVSFSRRTSVRGVWESTLTVADDGSITTEGHGDCVRTVREPKTVRCEECGKRYPNPFYDPT